MNRREIRLNKIVVFFNYKLIKQLVQKKYNKKLQKYKSLSNIFKVKKIFLISFNDIEIKKKKIIRIVDLIILKIYNVFFSKRIGLFEQKVIIAIIRIVRILIICV